MRRLTLPAIFFVRVIPSGDAQASLLTWVKSCDKSGPVVTVANHKLFSPCTTLNDGRHSSEFESVIFIRLSLDVGPRVAN
jgi:hypothetical protein